MEEKIRNELYEKMGNEFNLLINNLKKLPPEKIISSCYEKVIKEEIMLNFYPDNKNYDMNQIKALNKCDEPLNKLYDDWLNSDINFNEVIEDSISNSINDLVKHQKEKNKLKER